MPLPSLDEIKERKLVQWVLAYLGVAWLTLQVVVALGGVYGWPEWLLRTVPVLLIAGFFVALVVAWYHGEQGRQRVGGVELGILTVLFGPAGFGVTLIGPGGDGSHAADENRLVETTDLDNLSTDQAYDWGTSGNVEASTEVLDYLIQRSQSDSARMLFLTLGASLLSRTKEPDEAVAWIQRLMDIDPVALTLSSDAGQEGTWKPCGGTTLQTLSPATCVASRCFLRAPTWWGSRAVSRSYDMRWDVASRLSSRSSWRRPSLQAFPS